MGLHDLLQGELSLPFTFTIAMTFFIQKCYFTHITGDTENAGKY
jgi:hypothetical protein